MADPAPESLPNAAEALPQKSGGPTPGGGGGLVIQLLTGLSTLLQKLLEGLLGKGLGKLLGGLLEGLLG